MKKPLSLSSGIVVAATAATLGGCMAVAVDPEGGFPGVAGLVRERTGQSVTRDPGGADGLAEAAEARALLADGVTLEDSVRIALAHNREIQALYSDLGVAQSDLVQASLLHNPVADVAAGVPIGGGVADLSLGVAMDVVDLFYVPLRKRVAAAELEEVTLRVAAEVMDLAARTQRTYRRHQAHEQMLEMRRQIAHSTGASYELARRMRKAGNITALELATERALAEEARLDLRRAEMEARATREELTTLMGLWGNDADWRLASSRLPDPPEEEIDHRDLERRAIGRSLDLAMAERRLVAAGEQLGLNRASALFPEILLGGNGEREGGWEAGPSLSLALPFFDRGQARVARARAELRRARALHHALAVHVRSAARAARDRLVGHRERALYYRNVLLPLRAEVLRETQLQYNAMQLGPFEVLRAKEKQIDAGVGYVESLRDYWLAESDLGLILAGRVPPMGGEPAPGDMIESPRRSPIPTLN